MKLHANAALSLMQRRRMVSRVVDEGWSIKAAAAAAETSARTCGKWVSRYRASSRVRLLDRSSAPQHVANRTDERTVQVIAALRRLRFTGPEIAELLGEAALDRFGDPDPDRDGPARSTGNGARVDMDQLARPLALVTARRERRSPGSRTRAIEVETVGIEPTSAIARRAASTSVSGALDLALD